MNRAVIYSRVSTNEQTVENQLRVLREVAEKEVSKQSEKYLMKVSQVQREEMRDQGLMNSLKVLLRMNGILFWYGMYQDQVVH